MCVGGCKPHPFAQPPYKSISNTRDLIELFIYLFCFVFDRKRQQAENVTENEHQVVVGANMDRRVAADNVVPNIPDGLEVGRRVEERTRVAGGGEEVEAEQEEEQREDNEGTELEDAEDTNTVVVSGGDSQDKEEATVATAMSDGEARNETERDSTVAGTSGVEATASNASLKKGGEVLPQEHAKIDIEDVEPTPMEIDNEMEDGENIDMDDGWQVEENEIAANVANDMKVEVLKDGVRGSWRVVIQAASLAISDRDRPSSTRKRSHQTR